MLMPYCKKCESPRVYNNIKNYCIFCGTRLVLAEYKCESCDITYDLCDKFCTQCGGKNLLVYVDKPFIMKEVENAVINS